ncbi:MAG: CapA family protein [Chitinophagaceae bacterium]|nr:MAG: CapA family protein [Chitinophagaceae bacterium]
MKILIGGDVQPNLESNDYSLHISDELKEVISLHDHFFLNLECVYSEAKSKSPKVGQHFYTKKEFIQNIKAVGTTTLNLANNHIGDFGPEGISSTIDFSKAAGLSCMGAGTTAEEISKPQILEKNGCRVGILNYAETEFGSSFSNSSAGYNTYDLKQALRDIRYLKDKTDHIILIFHGGVEYSRIPHPSYKEEFRFLVDSGVKAIIAHHSHYYSGYESYNDGLIVYGVGNFMSYTTNKNHRAGFEKGLLASLSFTKTGFSFEIIPVKSAHLSNKVSTINDAERLDLEKSINEINELIANDESLTQYWKKWVLEKQLIDKYLFLIDTKPELIKKVFRRVGVKTELDANVLLNQLNIVRNPVHRSLFQSALELKFNSTFKKN